MQTQIITAGGFNTGGRIPRGRVGIVGEFGPELVEGPGNVRSRFETQNIFNQVNNSLKRAEREPIENNIRIINNLDTSVIEDFIGSSDGEELIINIMRANPEVMRAVING